MKKRIISAFLCLVSAFIFSTQAFSNEPSWQMTGFFVQERFFETTSDNFTRVFFEIKDADGAFPETDKLTSCRLTEPDSTASMDIYPRFSAYQEIDGVYDGQSGRWGFGSEYTFKGYFYEMPAGSLKPGTYKLEVVFDGTTLSKEFTSQGAVILPGPKARNLHYRFDKSGNLLAQWPVPTELFLSDPDLATSVRIEIDVREGTQFVGSLVTRVPTHMGRLFVPAHVMTIARGWGDSHQIRVQLRTNDQSTRIYSNWVPLRFPKPVKPPWWLH